MNKNNWIVYAICGLFIISCFFCIISLTYTSMENVTAKGLEDRINTCQKELVELSKEEAALGQWRDIGKYFNQFKNDYLMKIEDFSQFRDNLRITFSRFGLQNKSVSHSYTDVADYIKTKVTFGIEGTYPQIKRFIHDILNRKEMIIIKRIKLIKDKQTIIISGNFQLEVYLVK